MVSGGERQAAATAPGGAPPRRAALVVNHASGRHGSAEAITETVRDTLEAHGLAVEVFAEGGLMDRLGAAACSGADLLVAGGGDGTVAAAAGTAMRSGQTLAVVPLGTMNLLAKDVGLPLDVAAAAELAATGEARRIDVGEVRGRHEGDGPSRPAWARRPSRQRVLTGENLFLCAVMMGLPARLARHRERERGAFGPLAWIRLARATFASLSRYPALRVVMDLGQGPRRVRTRALTVANNALDEGFGGLFNRSSLEDGKLAVYIAPDMGVASFVKFIASVGLGDWSRSGDIEAHLVEEFTVTSRRSRLRVMLDGEVRLIAPPLTFVIRKRALSIVGPPRAAGEETGAEHAVGPLEAAASHAPEAPDDASGGTSGGTAPPRRAAE